MRALNSMLKVVETPLPELKPGQALIKVSCFGITADDVSVYNNPMAAKSLLGTEFSGVIADINDEVEKSSVFSNGDAVLGFTLSGGAMSEYVACDLTALVKIPVGISFIQAASLPDMWFTALQVVKRDLNIKKRERIAVFNAMSNRGQAVVKLAQLIGCRRVHCVVEDDLKSAEANLKLHAALPDEIVVHKNNSQLQDNILEYDMKGLETVIYVGEYPKELSPQLVRPSGCIGIVPDCFKFPNSERLVNISTYQMFILKNQKLVGCNPRRQTPLDSQANSEFIDTHIMPKYRNGQLTTTIDKVFRWEKARDAIEWINKHPELHGKVVCTVNSI